MPHVPTMFILQPHIGSQSLQVLLEVVCLRVMLAIENAGQQLLHSSFKLLMRCHTVVKTNTVSPPSLAGRTPRLVACPPPDETTSTLGSTFTLTSDILQRVYFTLFL